MSSLDQAAVLDLDLVRSQSMENPVYYVQYAHARIASIERRRAERGIERRPLEDVDLSLLASDRELELLRSLEELPDVVADAGRDRAPHKVTAWVRSLAGAFHGFYHDCPVLADTVGDDLTQARPVARRGGAGGARHRSRHSRCERPGVDVGTGFAGRHRSSHSRGTANAP